MQLKTILPLLDDMQGFNIERVNIHTQKITFTHYTSKDDYYEQDNEIRHPLDMANVIHIYNKRGTNESVTIVIA